MMRLGLTLGLLAMVLSTVLPDVTWADEKDLAMKGGETTDLEPVYWVANCRSLLKGKPTVEILEGPPEVTASIRDGNVVPRSTNCAKPVPGGTLVVGAPKQVKVRTEAQLTLRLKYPTIDGERQSTRLFHMILLP